MDNIRVSPRDLGKMLLARFCPRCYWYLIGLGFRVPFDMPMAGLMYNMDVFEKNLVQWHFGENEVAPKWMTELGCTEVVEFPKKMTMTFEKYGLTLVGMPDEVLRKKDKSLVLIDYKTAKDKSTDSDDGDPFMPAYETQLLGYVHLLEYHGIGKVSEAALVYFDNDLADYHDDPLALMTKDGLNVPFTVKIHPIKINRKALFPLMKDFREYAEMLVPPNGRTGCKHCARLDTLFSLHNKGTNAAKALESNLVNRDYILETIAKSRAESLIVESRLRQEELGEEHLSILDSVPGPMDL